MYVDGTILRVKSRNNGACFVAEKDDGLWYITANEGTYLLSELIDEFEVLSIVEGEVATRTWALRSIVTYGDGILMYKISEDYWVKVRLDGSTNTVSDKYVNEASRMYPSTFVTLDGGEEA